MKMLDFRKYFSSYLFITFSFLLMYECFVYANVSLPVPTDDPIITPGVEYRVLIFLYGFMYFCSIGLLALEILIRKFIIEKYFPGFKFFRKINMSKKLNKFLTVVFYILFSLSAIHLLFICFSFYS